MVVAILVYNRMSHNPRITYIAKQMAHLLDESFFNH